MITAEFYLKNDTLVGFSVKGHAGYDNVGYDIVCSAVTSLIELTTNAITDILMVNASVLVLDNEIKLTLPDGDRADAVNFLKALRLELEFLSQDYSDNIRLIDMEV
ncbi:MAG: ribosomal-processing cysteine protease Prp [Oscillospiraceae bacterium]